MGSPTQRTLAWCRKQGWRAQVVERWQPQSMRRIDLFGCVDVLALNGTKTVAIQSCAGASHAARVRKIREECGDALADMLRAGWVVLVQSWAKKGAAGKRKLWASREVEVTA